VRSDLIHYEFKVIIVSFPINSSENTLNFPKLVEFEKIGLKAKFSGRIAM